MVVGAPRVFPLSLIVALAFVASPARHVRPLATSLDCVGLDIGYAGLRGDREIGTIATHGVLATGGSVSRERSFERLAPILSGNMVLSGNRWVGLLLVARVFGIWLRGSAVTAAVGSVVCIAIGPRNLLCRQCCDASGLGEAEDSRADSDGALLRRLDDFHRAVLDLET